MAVYPGRNGIIYLSTSASGTATSVLSLSDFTFDRNTDLIEVTAFGDTNKTYVQSLPDLKFTFNGFWNDTETKPFAASASSDGCKVYLYPSTNIAQASGKYAYGTAWLNCNLNTSVSGAVQISGSGAAASSWYVGF